MNPVEISEAVSDLALEPFERGEFPFQFLAAFDNKPTTIQRLRSGNSNASDVPGGVLQAKNIHIATCGVGEVDATLRVLRDSPKTAKAKAQFILATDGETFQAEDLSDGETVSCAYMDFPEHFGFFLPLAGITTVPQIRENAFDVKATGRLNKLYLQLLRENPDWAKAERQHDMNHFMARLIFCFFAEDTDIFPGKSLFTGTVETMSARDSSDTHTVIGEIFRAMDTAHAKREGAGLPPYATKFPYVNGQLFSGSTDVPAFSKVARTYLLHVGNLPWQKINPDIFGSMIQAVTDEAERGSLGMHYTSVPNILKVLNPLFLDDLRAKLDEAGDNGRKLLNLRNRMARIRVFDPACGSGNFLVIAYKEMRAIEAQINARRGEPDKRSDIPLTNFRGIELREFPAEIARLALIIAEYQCDVLYRGQREALVDFLPLSAENWVTCGNALRLDWLSICPPTGTGVKVAADDLFQTPLDQAEIDFENEGGETYICGNPPYLGSKWQEDEQKADLEHVFRSFDVNWRSLDYVAGWFIKAAEYSKHTFAQIAFVSTNSVCQGIQVPTLWPTLSSLGLSTSFAHTSFRWSNLASNAAGVIVVIVGLTRHRISSPVIFSESGSEVVARQVDNINHYLVAAPDIEIVPRKNSTFGLPYMDLGNMPKDGGHLLFEADEARRFLSRNPEAVPFVRHFVGSLEAVRGVVRKCLWITDNEADQAASIPEIRERLAGVREMRLASPAPSTRAFADRPHRFKQIQGIGQKWTVVIPKVTSENRPYLPVALLPSHAIVSDAAFALYDAPIWTISLIASKLHLVWVATICGKLKTDYRYSNTLGWNTFPLPKLTEQNKADLMRCAENVLLAREAHFPATIADLYDPDEMPDDLRRAHDANDEVLERIYIGRRFRNDTERLEKLFELYTKMTGKTAAA
jgi:hypothetical protein